MNYRVNGYCPRGHLVTLRLAEVAGLERLEVLAPEGGCDTCENLAELEVKREMKKMERRLRRGKL